MITPTQRIALIQQLGDYLQTLEGRSIEISESISHDLQRGHDRHCTTYSGFRFVVERVLWTISGGNFVLYGPPPFQYAISSGQLYSFTQTGDEAVICERYETRTERRSVLKPLSE